MVERVLPKRLVPQSSWLWLTVREGRASFAERGRIWREGRKGEEREKGKVYRGRLDITDVCSSVYIGTIKQEMVINNSQSKV